MAAVSPSPGSSPSIVPPPPVSSAAPPQPSTPPPTPSTPAEEPNASTSDPPTLPPPSPPPNAPPPSDSQTPPHPAPPPVDAPPPPSPSAPPPSPPGATPPTPIPVPQPPPPLPPSVSSPPPQTPSPPPLSPPNPPTSAPPPPALSTPPTSSPPPPPPPPSSSSPPPISSSTPPSLNQPTHSPPPPPPPPPSSDPPVAPPPPPPSKPPRNSPPPPTSHPPRSSPSPPTAEPPSTSAPSSTGSPPPPDPQSIPPPDPQSIPPPPSPSSSSSHPPPGSEPAVPSSPSLLAPPNSSFDAPKTPKGGGKGGIGSGGTVAIGIVAGILILGLIGLVAFCIFKRKKRISGANGGHVIPASLSSSPRSDGKLLVKTEYPGSHYGGGSGSDTPADHGGYGHSRSWFTYQELLEATSGFSDDNLLGEGGFGYVYKGMLVDGRVVAVKQLKIGGSQGEREFKAEVEIISRIHHRHLVSLVGYCIWDSRRLLVYDYVPNNTLHFHLHGVGSSMDWTTRVRIAAGAARGIAYLHEDCHPRIIHRDIKSSNILLDNNFEARVSDFGLAKLAMDADTHVSTRVMGTFGYLAPEYATTGKLTEKSDVYSFGVVLLELLTGRKPVDESQPLGDESLVEWARPMLIHALDKGEYEDLVDPQLEKNFVESEMFRMIEAAAACVRHSAAKRPRMGQVVRAFDGISDSGDLSNGLRVGESQVYNSAQQSAEMRWFRRMAFGSQDISTDFFSSPSQNFGYSTQSGSRNVNLGGDISRQDSQNSHNTGFSRQSRQNFAGTGY